MLFSEYMVAEQAKLYARAQGLGGPRYWAFVDFLYRLGTKGVLRTYQAVFHRFFSASPAPAPDRRSRCRWATSA